jgi:hypothetical protein
VLTHEQIARTFFSQNTGKEEPVSSVLEELQEAGYLESYSAMVHPEIELTAPLCSYSPGDLAPDFGAIARETRGRWKRAPVTTDIVHATQHAKRVFGGYLGGKKPRPSETRHDIHVAQLYLNLSTRDAAAAAAWVSEAELRQERSGNCGPVPDAEIRTAKPLIIEFAGSYPRQKLEAFHVEQRTRRYELW